MICPRHHDQLDRSARGDCLLAQVMGTLRQERQQRAGGRILIPVR